MAAFLIDISRTISRAPHPHPTGIDRVERAYIKHFLKSESPVWFLSRVLKGYALIDRTAMHSIWPMICGDQPWQRQDLIARLFSHKMHKVMSQAESTLRRLAVAHCSRLGLTKMLSNNLPAGFTYLNVGHTNRKSGLWSAMENSGAGQKLAMMHDVIPLDYPAYSGKGVVERFEHELKLTASACDALIYNSADTATRTEFWLQKSGLNPTALINLLGVDPLPMPALKPAAEPAEFIILGTIEPRKNHQLLLDIWPEINAHLHIIGARGWLNEAVFSTLDTSPMMEKTVFEHRDLTDTALAARLSTARALLFPSIAEGFGYPLIEALQMGLPVICSDLPCFREIAGNLPTYLAPDDKLGWTTAIMAATRSPREKIPKNVSFPTWDQHFAKLDMFLYNGGVNNVQKAGK